MKRIFVLIVLFIFIMSCVEKTNSRASSDSAQKVYTGAKKKVRVNLVDDIESYDVKPVNPNELVHSSSGSVVFTTKVFEAPFEFHEVMIFYKIGEPEVREIHEQELIISIRYSNDLEHWSEWSANSQVLSEGKTDIVSRVGRLAKSYPELRNRFGGTFNYFQISLNSSFSQGEVILRDLYLIILRYKTLDLEKKIKH